MNTPSSNSGAFTFPDPVTGREVLQLTNDPRYRSVHSYFDIPPWHPQTRRIVFTRMLPNAKEGEIWIVDQDGANPRKVADTRSVSMNEGAMVQWAADGARCYYKDRRDGEPHLAWVDTETGEHGAVPGDLRMVRPTGHEQVYHSHCLNDPDEVLLRTRDERGVFIMDLETGQSRMIASIEDCRKLNPRCDEMERFHLYIKHTKWSPDGSRLFFVFTNEIHYDTKYNELPRVKDIYVINADGSGLRRVGEAGGHPIWHPDGQQILANFNFGEPEGRRISLLDVETGVRRVATRAMAAQGHPSFSPDGKKIVVDAVDYDVGYAGLHLIDPADDSCRQLVHMKVTDHSHRGTHLHPVWSREGDELLYASDGSGLAQLCVIRV